MEAQINEVEKLLWDKYSDAAWYPMIRQAIRKEGEYGDVTDIHHVATSLVKDPKKHKELHKAVDLTLKLKDEYNV